jgi:hypothetical protein
VAWGDVPTIGLLVGSAIVVASGLFLLWHETARGRRPTQAASSLLERISLGLHRQGARARFDLTESEPRLRGQVRGRLFPENALTKLPTLSLPPRQQ